MVGLGIRNLFHGIFLDVYTSAVNVTPFYILTLKIAAREDVNFIQWIKPSSSRLRNKRLQRFFYI